MNILKRGFLITLLNILFVCSLYSQNEDVLRPKGKPLTAEEMSQYSWVNHPDKKPWTIGIEGGLNFNMFSQKLERDFPLSSPEDVLKSGFGISPFAGLLIDYSFTNQVAVQLRVDYDIKNYSNKVESAIDASDPSGNITNMLVSAEYNAKSTYLSVTPLIRYNIDERFFLLGGITFQSRMGDYTREDIFSKSTNDDTTWINIDYNLVPGQYSSVSGVVTNANTNFLPPVTQTFPQVQSTLHEYVKSRMGIEVGIGYLFPLSNSIALATQARYQYMFGTTNETFTVTDVSRAPSNKLSNVTYSNAMLHSVQLAIGLWFKL